MLKLPHSYRLPLFFIILEMFGFVYMLRLDSQKSNDDFYNYYRKLPVIAAVIDKKNENINKAIGNYIGKIPGDYAVYIKELKSGEVFGSEEKKVFGSASLYKLAILNEVYGQIEKEKLHKDDVLTASQAELDKILNPIEDDEGGKVTEVQETQGAQISYTVEYAVELMIRISDNYSALMLADRVGWKNTELNLKKTGILGFDLTGENAPTVDAQSVGQLLENMYTGKAVSEEASLQMIDLLSDQRINDRIPKLLPDGVIVAHKTGEIDKIRHDAGIVFGKKSDYIIVLLTETDAPLDTVDNMAEFSKNVYDLLEN